MALCNVGLRVTVPELIKALKDTNKTVRKYAAEALGKSRLKEAIPSLVEVLSDEDNSVRLSATTAIGKICS